MEPKKKHANFRHLDEPTQQKLLRLAAILRLAGGLDRSHSQRVERVAGAGGEPGVEMLVFAPTLPEVDRRAADQCMKVVWMREGEIEDLPEEYRPDDGLRQGDPRRSSRNR